MAKIRSDLDIGTNIKIQRIRNKMTQDQVVAKLNLMGISIGRGAYSHIETNRLNIRVSELKALKEIFKLDSYDPFFEGL